MSATLKLGTDGNWAAKKGSVLSYNDENGNFKPLPFTFDRSTSATRVNKQGLIEVVSNNEPRIDFTNDSKGALLLEPSRSNYWTYSEGSDITLNSPLGEFGFYTINNTFLNRAITYVGTINFTFIIKKIDGTIPTITTSSGSGDLIVLVSGSSTAGLTGVLTDIGNGFYKYELTTEANGASVARIHNKSGIDTYVSLIQYEDSSYPTSYIPTQGSIGTRVAESCVQTPPSGIIGQTEGTVYLESNNLYPSGTRTLGMLYTSGSAFYQIYLTSSNQIRVDINGALLMLSSAIDLSVSNKIAFAYKSAENVLYLNGVSLATSTSTSIPSSLNDFHLGNFNGNEQSGSFTNSKLYNTRLSNSELAALTQV